MNILKNPLVIVANGDFPSHPIPLEILNKAISILACDGAADTLLENNYTPNLILGDLDSLSKENKLRKYVLLNVDFSQFPVCVYRTGSDKYVASLMQCTHNVCGLVVEGGIYACPCHGSEFSTEGEVLEGPAQENLKNSNQDINKLKILLANETTTMLHGSKAAKDSELTAQKTFGDKSIGKNLPVIKIKKSVITSGVNILDVVIQTKLANSKGEIRRMIKNNGLRINNEVITDETKTIDQSNFVENNNLKVSHGKKQHIIVKII